MRRVAVALISVAFVNALLVPAGAARDPLDPLTQQAATFAIRAIAHAGLLDPLGEYYSYETIFAGEDGWVVSFVASHCYQNDRVETCDPYQGRGEDLEPDAWVEISDADGAFEITDAFGRFSDEQRDHVAGYSESSELEEGHAAFPTVRLDPARNEEGYYIRAAGMWAGVLPARGRISTLCRPEVLDADGNVVWSDERRYAYGSRGERDRSGWIVGTGALKLDSASSARMTCANFSGETWRMTRRDPSVTKIKKKAYVNAEMRWLLGDLVVNLTSKCEVQLFDRKGDLVKEAVKRGPPSPFTNSWRDGRFSAVIWVGRSKPTSASIHCQA
jgi:hypothetical protein